MSGADRPPVAPAPAPAMQAAISRAIARVLSGVAPRDVAAAARDVSARYRAGGPGLSLRSGNEALAYVATRLPATCAAARLALEHVAELLGAFAPATQLDLGAGPGAAAWAASDVWPSIGTVVLRDTDEHMIRLGEELAAGSFPGWAWHRVDVRLPFEPADLVTATYSLGELSPGEARDVASRAWAATTGCLLVVEPGTPAGFRLIRDLRDHLIGEGAGIVAPCPNEQACPIAGDDWCHFAARLGRSGLHRQLKAAERSFEDEKFSYVAFARSSGEARAAGRVVRRPVRRRRFVELSVCTGGEIRRVGLGQSHPGYRPASKLAWGDVVPDVALDPSGGSRPT